MIEAPEVLDQAAVEALLGEVDPFESPPMCAVHDAEYVLRTPFKPMEARANFWWVQFEIEEEFRAEGVCIVIGGVPRYAQFSGYAHNVQPGDFMNITYRLSIQFTATTTEGQKP